jgi:hypothetical protein
VKVYTYESIERPSRHCREELAVERDPGVLIDTFWSLGSESHRLTQAEKGTAVLVFDTDDYDQLPTYPRDAARRTWETYRSDDRAIITSQHGLQNDYYVRKGSKPDLATRIENAERVVEAAESNLRSAESGVRWAREDLATLIGERTSSDTGGAS